MRVKIKKGLTASEVLSEGGVFSQPVKFGKAYFLWNGKGIYRAYHILGPYIKQK